VVAWLGQFLSFIPLPSILLVLPFFPRKGEMSAAILLTLFIIREAMAGQQMPEFGQPPVGYEFYTFL
jgi:hypothetical protein